VLDYKLPYHVIQEDEEETFRPKLSFKTLVDAKEFVRFASSPNLIIVKTNELKDYYIRVESKKYEF
jgi:hypothetical protein